MVLVAYSQNHPKMKQPNTPFALVVGGLATNNQSKRTSSTLTAEVIVPTPIVPQSYCGSGSSRQNFFCGLWYNK
jgi:hypothetical protein